MATVGIVFGTPMQGAAQVRAGNASASEAITSSGTSQRTSAAAGVSNVVSITSVGGAIWAAVGKSPTAAAGTAHLIPDGGTIDLACSYGDKVAVIDA